APEEAGAMGDDIIDVPMLRACGFAAAPANARREARAAAHFVSRHAGGAGAARDCIEFVLRSQKRWQAATAEYLRLPGPG
ncbi:MAG: HAD hydrolase family protein, partial [Terriglobales bacterium]